MAIPPNDDSGHADEIFGVSAYKAYSPPKKEFNSLHLPRKQFVRDRQWCEQIRKLLDDSSRDGESLKYLGLPGVDLLDLRHIYNTICEPRNMSLCFLGFNHSANSASQEQVELNISLDEVRKLSLVDPKSDVIGDDFCRIANDNSLAWKRAQALGPYDVINLDLCDGFAKHAPGGLADTHYQALTQLLSLQARYKNSWLLLLTTRAGQGHIHEEALEKMLNHYLKNLLDHSQFKAESFTKFEIADENTLRKAIGTSAGLLQVFLVGISKWFVSLALNQNPPSNVEVKSVIGYRVDEKAEIEDLISLAVRFEPTFAPVTDSLGLAQQTEPHLSECDLAIKALRRVSNRKNADEILRSDLALNDTLIEAMANLLELARYDVAAYRDWLSQA